MHVFLQLAADPMFISKRKSLPREKAEDLFLPAACGHGRSVEAGRPFPSKSERSGAAGAITRNFRFPAIGVEQTSMQVSILQPDQHPSIGADTSGSHAHAPGDLGEIGLRRFMPQVSRKSLPGAVQLCKRNFDNRSFRPGVRLDSLVRR